MGHTVRPDHQAAQHTVDHEPTGSIGIAMDNRNAVDGKHIHRIGQVEGDLVILK